MTFYHRFVFSIGSHVRLRTQTGLVTHAFCVINITTYTKMSGIAINLSVLCRGGSRIFKRGGFHSKYVRRGGGGGGGVEHRWTRATNTFLKH